jgi:hypothetical protein
MRCKSCVTALICLVLLSLLFAAPNLDTAKGQTSPDMYVGVDMAYGHGSDPAAVAVNVADAKALIDQVSSFTNFFIVGTSGISDTTSLNETLQYAYDKGLSFMSFIPNSYSDLPEDFNPYYLDSYLIQWLTNDKNAWGDRLIGFLSPPQDEPGGRQIDQYSGRLISLSNNASSPDYVSNYTDAAANFESRLRSYVTHSAPRGMNQTMFPLFTSDYALYWFDYKSGYDGILAQFGWNNSRQLTTALCRGAAEAQGKQWGVVLTYTYDIAPYLESGPQLYNDMVYAYNSGAKYIVIFDSNENYTQSILQPEHLLAMQQFWDYAKTHTRSGTPASGRTALVLPYGYALAFRSSFDSLWGIWPQDVFPQNITAVVHNALHAYGDNLDIVYDEGLQAGSNMGYSQMVNWNDSALTPITSLSPSPTATPSQVSSPSLTPDHNGVPPTGYIVIAATIVVVAVFVGIALAFRKVQAQNNST